MGCDGSDEAVVLLASPRGFCAGVRRAIRVVELACEHVRGPVFVRHEIVHNGNVIRQLERRGAKFVEELEEIPAGATTIFSAHGVSASVRAEAARRRLDVIDATCPLVGKVHREVVAHVAQGRHVILIGHPGHPEVDGTLGQVAPGSVTLISTSANVAALELGTGPMAYAMQTTLSVDEAAETVAALHRRWPGIAGPDGDDICYATTNRQRAVKQLAELCEAILVVGSANSSNSRRLAETAERCGVHSQLIEDELSIDWRALGAARRIGITAGASAPEDIVQCVAGIVAERLGGCPIVEMEGPAEPSMFALPRNLPTGTPRGAAR
jgi:4-hydroxy-3-methylbut-2-enyl diphosphate reductase